MNFLPKLRSLLLVLLLYEIVVEVRSRKIERKPKKDSRTKSKTRKLFTTDFKFWFKIGRGVQKFADRQGLP